MPTGAANLVLETRPGSLSGTGQQIVLSAPEIAAGTLTAASAAGASWATAAIPIVGPIIAGVTLGLGFLFGRKRPKQKVAATHIVDELEPMLRQNRDAYLAGPRTPEAQQQALANFDAGWEWLTSAQACGNPELGPPGEWCIADRVRGGKWDWFALYRDPIEQTPPDAPDQVLADILPGGGAGSLSPAALLGLALIVAGATL